MSRPSVRVSPGSTVSLAASLMEASDDAIVGRTLEGTVFSWNSGAERMFGYRAAEIIGHPISPLVPSDRQAELSQVIERVRLGRSMLQYETVRLRKDGRPLSVQQTVSPGRDLGGEVKGMVVISRDISELKRLQSLVLETADRVQRSIGQDLHDGLSQQLSGVSYLSHLLLRRLEAQSLPEATEAQRILDLMNEAGQQARAIARGLLPVKGEPAGLAVPLRRLASTMERTYPLVCWFLGEPNLRIHNATVATHPYRIAQEAVHNGVKHSQPREVLIHLGNLTLDQSNGLDLIKDLGARWASLPVLVLSNHDEALYAERCIRAGARGYVMMDRAPTELIAAVNAVLSGRFHLSDGITHRILSRLGSGPSRTAGDLSEGLTDRELQVFELYGKGRTTRQIAELLRLSVKTVESHRDHIKEKLGFTDSASLVRAAVHWVEVQHGL